MPARSSVAVPAQRATEGDLRATPQDGQKYDFRCVLSEIL